MRRGQLGSYNLRAGGGARQLSSSQILVRDERCALVPSVEKPVEAGKSAARNVSCGGASAAPNLLQQNSFSVAAAQRSQFSVMDAVGALEPLDSPLLQCEMPSASTHQLASLLISDLSQTAGRQRMDRSWRSLRVDRRYLRLRCRLLGRAHAFAVASIASIASAPPTTVAWPLSPQGDGGRVTAWRPAIRGAGLDSNPPSTHSPPLAPPSPPLLPPLPRPP